MEKKVTIKLSTFILGIIAIILFIVIIFMGMYIVKQNNILQQEQSSINTNNKPTSIIISGYEDMPFYAIDGYETERTYTWIPITDIDKYKNKKYSVYTKNKYWGDTIVEPTEGPFSEMVSLNHNLTNRKYDDNFELEILIDTKYDAIPRKSEIIDLPSSIKNNIQEFNEYSNYEIEKIDLEGDGKSEYFVVLWDKNNTEFGKSKIILLNNNYNKVADLVEIINGSVFKYYPKTSDLIYVDFDNDKIMEILITLPSYEGGPDYTVFKYIDGKIIGNKEKIDLKYFP